MAAYFGVWLLWVLVSIIRQHEIPGAMASLSAAYVIALLLVGAALVIPSDSWPANYAAVAFGLFVPALLGLALSLVQRTYDLEHFALFRILWQIVPLPGLLLWLAAASTTEPQAQRAAA